MRCCRRTKNCAGSSRLQQESVKTLTDSLAHRMRRRKLFRRKYSDLQLRMEALGLESANKDRAKLEQRLLKAVSDLQLMREENANSIATRCCG